MSGYTRIKSAMRKFTLKVAGPIAFNDRITDMGALQNVLLIKDTSWEFHKFLGKL